MLNQNKFFAPVAGDNIYGWEWLDELEGFPFACSTSGDVSSPMLVDLDSDEDVELVAINGENDLLIIDTPYNFLGNGWLMYRAGRGRGACFLSGPPADMIPLEPKSYIVENSFYSYPNPATDDFVRIRYKLLKQSNQNPQVKIFDLAGELIAQFEGEGTGAYNEIVWDISDIASGVYICGLEVQGEIEFCKIAIAK